METKLCVVLYAMRVVPSRLTPSTMKKGVISTSSAMRLWMPASDLGHRVTPRPRASWFVNWTCHERYLVSGRDIAGYPPTCWPLWRTGAPGNAIAASTHGAEGLSVAGTVVAEPTPVLYSLHPLTELHAPPRVYPDPAVKVVDVVSIIPITIELPPGVSDATAALVELVGEFPVDVTVPVVQTSTSS